MGTQPINRRTHSPPPESGDSVDRIDMARRNFENDPADVRAALPKEGSKRLQHSSSLLPIPEMRRVPPVLGEVEPP